MRKHIKSLAYSRLSRQELIGGTDRILTMVARRAEGVPGIGVSVQAVAAALDTLEEVQKATRRSPLTRQLMQLDRQRDDALRGLRSYLRGVSRLPDENSRVSAAERIMFILDKQGKSVWRRSYVHESAALKVMLEELATPDARTDVAVLGVGPQVDRLASAQSGFEALHQQKLQAVAQYPAPDSEATVTALCYRLDTLLNLIEATHEAAQPPLDSLIIELNEEIGGLMNLVRTRSTRNRAEPVTASAGAAAVG